MKTMLVTPHLDYAVEFWFPFLNRNITHNIVRLNQMARGLENTLNDWVECVEARERADLESMHADLEVFQ